MSDLMSLTPGENAGGLLQDARAALKNGKSEQAFDAALKGMKHELSQEQAAELHRIAAEALIRQGKLRQARTYAESGLAYGRASGDYRAAYDSAMTVGRVFAVMSNYAAAEQMWSEALTLAGMHQDKRLQALVLLDMAMLDQRRGNHKRALNSLESVRKSFEKSKSLRPLAICYGRMVLSFIEDERFDDALHYSDKIESLALKLEDKQLEAIAHFRKSSIFLKQDNFNEALVHLREAARLFEEVDDVKNLALVLCDLARVHVNLEKFSEAQPLLEQVGILAEKMESPDVSAKLKITLADRSTFLDQWEEARSYYLEALTKVEQTLNEDRLSVLHESLKKTLKKLGFSLTGLKDLLTRARKCYLQAGLVREAEETERWLTKIPLTG